MNREYYWHSENAKFALYGIDNAQINWLSKKRLPLLFLLFIFNGPASKL